MTTAFPKNILPRLQRPSRLSLSPQRITIGSRPRVMPLSNDGPLSATSASLAEAYGHLASPTRETTSAARDGGNNTRQSEMPNAAAGGESTELAPPASLLSEMPQKLSQIGEVGQLLQHRLNSYTPRTGPSVQLMSGFAAQQAAVAAHQAVVVRGSSPRRHVVSGSETTSASEHIGATNTKGPYTSSSHVATISNLAQATDPFRASLGYKTLSARKPSPRTPHILRSETPLASPTIAAPPLTTPRLGDYASLGTNSAQRSSELGRKYDFRTTSGAVRATSGAVAGNPMIGASGARMPVICARLSKNGVGRAYAQARARQLSANMPGTLTASSIVLTTGNLPTPRGSPSVVSEGGESCLKRDLNASGPLLTARKMESNLYLLGLFIGLVSEILCGPGRRRWRET